MVKPLTLKEQIQKTPFIADFKAGLYFAQSSYDAVWMIDKGRVHQALKDLKDPNGQSKPWMQCQKLKELFQRYGVDDFGG